MLQSVFRVRQVINRTQLVICYRFKLTNSRINNRQTKEKRKYIQLYLLGAFTAFMHEQVSLRPSNSFDSRRKSNEAEVKHQINRVGKKNQSPSPLLSAILENSNEILEGQKNGSFTVTFPAKRNLEAVKRLPLPKKSSKCGRSIRIYSNQSRLTGSHLHKTGGAPDWINCSIRGEGGGGRRGHTAG